MKDRTAEVEKLKGQRSGKPQSAAAHQHDRASGGLRKMRDPIRVNFEKVIEVTERSLNISDRKKKNR
jgi:hypothetical protein